MISNQQPTEARTPQRLLGIWAHPDDEAYLSADLMARTVAAGGSVTLIALTDGEGGFGADDHRSAAAKSAQRRAELTEAMAVIGVRDIRFLGAPDGGVVAHRSSPLAERIARIVRRVAPDVIATFGPDGITGHPDHIACSRLATMAWSETRIGELWYATKSDEWLAAWDELHQRLGVVMTDDGDTAGLGGASVDVRLVVEGDGLAVKRRVLAAHRSQTEPIAGVMGEDVYLQWIAEECFRHPTDDELFAADPFLAVANWCHPKPERSWS